MVSRKLLIPTNFLVILLVGCSAKYQCETAKTGVCAGVEDVYEAIYSKNGRGAEASVISETGYISTFPLREPERVYRVWIKDYEDENGFLISNHFIYVVVEGRWKVGARPQQKYISEEYYDTKIKEYLMRSGKAKPANQEEEDDVDI